MPMPRAPHRPARWNEADPRTRLAMLCAIPRLRDRADEPATGRPGGFAGLTRLLRWVRPGRPG